MNQEFENPPSREGESFSFEGSKVRLRGKMLNLTDMWRAASTTPDRRPWKWLRLDETVQFQAHLQKRWPGRKLTSENPIGRLAPNWLPGGDPMVVAERGQYGSTWAHWQLAFAYARYLSPAFHRWCNTVVRRAILSGRASSKGRDPVTSFVTGSFEQAVLARLERLDRNDCDIMFLLAAMKHILHGERKEFSARSRQMMCDVVAGEEYDGQCPSCLRNTVIDAEGQPFKGAEFDHFFSAKLNKADNGWLICKPCHYELSYGSYLARNSRIHQFRRFQELVLDEMRRSKDPAADD